MDRIFSFAVFVVLFTLDFAASSNSDSQTSGSEYEVERIIRRDEWETYSTGIYGPYGWNKNSLIVNVGLLIEEPTWKEPRDPKIVFQKYRDIVYELNLVSQKFNIYIALVSFDTWPSPNVTYHWSFGNHLEIWDTLAKKAKEAWDEINMVHFVSASPERGSYIRGLNNCEGEKPFSITTGTPWIWRPFIIYEFSQALLNATFGVNETDGTVFGCKKDDRFEWCPSVVKQVEENFAEWNNRYHCLKNKPTRLFGEPMCGNGYLERGEECDCGSTESCGNTSCCDAKTCRRFPDVPCLMGRL